MGRNFSNPFRILKINLEGWNGMGGRFKREGTYVYLWLVHVDVWQKPIQYCKAIIHQLKIKGVHKITCILKCYVIFLGSYHFLFIAQSCHNFLSCLINSPSNPSSSSPPTCHLLQMIFLEYAFLKLE